MAFPQHQPQPFSPGSTAPCDRLPNGPHGPASCGPPPGTDPSGPPALFPATPTGGDWVPPSVPADRIAFAPPDTAPPHAPHALPATSDARPVRPKRGTPSARQEGVQATPVDVVNQLPFTTGAPSSVLASVQQSLRMLGKRCSMNQLQAWIAMAKPRLHPQWPALTTFASRAADAISADPARLDSADAFLQLMVELAGPQACGPSLIDFLENHQEPVIQQLLLRRDGCMPTDLQTQALTIRPNCSDEDELQACMPHHRHAINECVRTMAADGYPTDRRELHALLWVRGLRLSPDLMDRLADFVPDLAYSQGFYFPAGEQPGRMIKNLPQDEITTLFRGLAPMVSTLIGVTRRAQDRGLAGELLRRHPGGFDNTQFQAVLDDLRLPIGDEQRPNLLSRLLHRGLVRKLDHQHWALDENYLCRSARQRIVSRQVADGAPIPRSNTSILAGNGAELIGAVLTLVRDAQKAGQLQLCMSPNFEGQLVFDAKKIREGIWFMGKRLSVHSVKTVLEGLELSSLPLTLEREQWMQPAHTDAELRDRLQALLRAKPCAAFASRPQVTAWINAQDPDHFCTPIALTEHLQALPRDPAAVARALDDLIDRGDIALFVDLSREPAFDHEALASHLGYLGIGTTQAMLDDLLTARQPRLKLSPHDRLPADHLVGDIAQHIAATAVMHKLGLNIGDPMPSWDRYLEAFRQSVCHEPLAGKTLAHGGEAALQIHLRIERMLKGLPARSVAFEQARDFGPAGRPASNPRFAGTASHRPAEPDSSSGPQTKRRRQETTGVSTTRPSSAGVAATRQASRFQPAPGGLHQLGRAMADALRTVLAPGTFDNTWDRAATPEDARSIAHALVAPPSADGARGTAPSWTTLQLAPHHWHAARYAVLGDLDTAVLMRSDGTPSPIGAITAPHFTAVRRDSAGLASIGADGPASLTLANGQFWAAVPVTACRGTVSRLVSYTPIAGFTDACDVVADITGTPAPLDAFSHWLDARLGLSADTPHAVAHRIRTQAFDMIDFGSVAAYLREHHGLAPQRRTPALPLLTMRDAGHALHEEIRWRTAHLTDGVVALLNLPAIGRSLALRWSGQRLCAVVGPTAVPLGEWLASVAAQTGHDLQAELYHF